MTKLPDNAVGPGSPKVFVVLGTCNGVQYLPEFTESLRSQSYADWTMLARDDASRDATATMLREMAAEEKRFVVLKDDATRHGPAKNFGALLQRAYDLGAEYVFLADQDDVWLREKIAKQMDRMRTAEAKARNGTPILAYSDLTVVDARLRTIHHSFFRHARFCHDHREPLRTLLAHNFIPGCALLLNRPLLELALPVPSSAPMHDWWISLCAAAAGQLTFLPEPMVLYRQHGGNAVGAPALWALLSPLAKGRRKRWKRAMANFAGHLKQTKVLQRRLQQRTPSCRSQTITLLDRYCRLLETPTGAFRRIDGMHRLGIPKVDLFRRLLFYARILRIPS